MFCGMDAEERGDGLELATVKREKYYLEAAVGHFFAVGARAGFCQYRRKWQSAH